MFLLPPLLLACCFFLHNFAVVLNWRNLKALRGWKERTLRTTFNGWLENEWWSLIDKHHCPTLEQEQKRNGFFVKPWSHRLIAYFNACMIPFFLQKISCYAGKIERLERRRMSMAKRHNKALMQFKHDSVRQKLRQVELIGSTFDVPCAGNVSFSFPHRLFFLLSKAHVCLLFSFLAETFVVVVVYCLFFSDICVVTAAVAWHFFTHSDDTHRKKKLFMNSTENLRRERKSGTVMQWGVQWPAFFSYVVEVPQKIRVSFSLSPSLVFWRWNFYASATPHCAPAL